MSAALPTVFGVSTVFFALACDSEPEMTQAERQARIRENHRLITERRETERLIAEMERALSEPCATGLYFEKNGATWFLTCDGCASRRAERMYDSETLATLATVAGERTRVSLTDLLRYGLVCP